MSTLLEGIGGVVRIGFTILFSPLLKGWYSKWGTVGDESSRPLPGDELVPQPKRQFTCGISIDAPAAEVWPWLVQIGCQRAGWYSYDLLDNGGVRSADQILPEFQKIAVGDPIYATRDGKMSFPVAQLLPGKALVLGGTMDTRTGKGATYREDSMLSYFSGGMVFYLYEKAEGVTRLLFRQRLDWNRSFFNNLAYGGFLDPIAFVMTQKTLKTLKERIHAASRK